MLQFFSHEEGRVRYKADNNTYVYDYLLKDHLGNVRMVLTEEQKINYYPATTFEGIYDGTSNTMVNYESKFYKIASAYIVPETSIPSWGTETVANTKLYYNNNGNPPANLSYPTACTPAQTDGSNKLYKLNATTNKTGLEFMIKVMAGDHIDIFGKSYYLNTTQITNSNSTTLDALSLLTNMLLSPANPIAGKGITGSQLNTKNNGMIPSSFFRGNNSEPATTVPKAYINYILLDEQFKFVSGNASRVGASGVVKDNWQTDAQLQNITIPKNGYIFVYVSNESNFDVFFDNLQVIHKPGPLLEETHYYPFGLTMAGISSKAAGSLINKKLFNGNELQNKEFSDCSGLELYDFNARTYDQQVGRFIQIDPTPEDGDQECLTPYHFSGNNPSTFNDPNGKCPWCIGAIVGAVVDAGLQLTEIALTDKKLSKFSFTSVAVSAGAGALSGGISSIAKVKQAGTLIKLAVEVGTDAGVSAGSQLIKDGNVTLKKTLIDVGAGQIVGRGVGAVVEKKAATSTTANRLKETINKEKNIARGKSNTTPKAQAKVSEAKKELDQYVDTRAASSATAASGAASTATEKIVEKKKKE